MSQDGYYNSIEGRRVAHGVVQGGRGNGRSRPCSLTGNTPSPSNIETASAPVPIRMSPTSHDTSSQNQMSLSHLLSDSGNTLPLVPISLHGEYVNESNSPQVHGSHLQFQLNSEYPNSSGSGLDLSQAASIDIVQEAKDVIRKFLQKHTCYELIKNSGKVVVFDVKIPINLAFFALVEHDIKSVPVWDADQGKFVGMFTATDFVNILRHFYIRGSPMNELAEYSIASWRAIPRALSMAPQREGMIYITPEHTLYDACKVLRDHRLHRVPALDVVQNSVLSITTHSGILEFLVSTFREQRRLFDQPIYDLGIGTYTGIVTIPEDMPLIRVLHTLVERGVSALPIVDQNDTVVNIYCVSNVTELVKDRSLTQLDMPVGDILRIQAAEGNSGEGLHLCYKTDTLHMIFERFAAVKAHRLVCVDEYTRCVGIVSLSDLFNYFV